MATKAATNGVAPDAAPEAPELSLEQKVDTLIYLHAEMTLRFQQLANAMAGLLAQQMQPQVQQAILQRLMG